MKRIKNAERTRKGPFPLDLAPLKIDLEPLPELDLDALELPDSPADSPRKARKGGKRHGRAR
jgi:hypothetical protein